MARSRNGWNMARHSNKPLIAGTIVFLKELPVVVSVIGATDTDRIADRLRVCNAPERTDAE